jgi:protein gp37
MKLENNIGWCDVTLNAVTGCDKVSPGCKNCYAEAGTRARVLRSQGIETWGPKGVRHPVKGFAAKLARLNKLCVCDDCHQTFPFDMPAPCYGMSVNHDDTQGRACRGPLRRIRCFADSNSDWLDPKWPVETLAAFLDNIRLAPNVDVLLLTKRIERFWATIGHALASAEKIEGDWPDRDPETELGHWLNDWHAQSPPNNIWIGVSAEDQQRADERIPLLLEMPAAVRFLSVEPLLEVVDLKLEDGLDRVIPGLDWCIIGGESGPNYRDCGVSAIVNVAKQCRDAGVPCYVKQDARTLPGHKGRIPDEIWQIKQFPKIHEPRTILKTV